MYRLTSLFHDIGLWELGEPYISTDPNHLSPEQFRVYKTHPSLSAKKMSQFKMFNQSMIQTMDQHHMRIRGASFPERTPGTQVHRMADIIGICDEIIEYVKFNQYSSVTHLYEELQTHVFPQFSQVLVERCKKIFFPELDQKN